MEKYYQFAIKIGTDEKGNQYFTHLKCGRKSYNPNDIKFKYCAVCHTFPEQEQKQYVFKQAMKQVDKREKRMVT
jgi:ribosomal protein L37E